MRIILPSGTPAEIHRVEGSSRGLVVFPDIFGLRPLFDDLVRQLAQDWGMTTIAVEPFPGHVFGTDANERFAQVSSLSDVDKMRDLMEAADATQCPSVAMIGFCMGGMYCHKAVQTHRFSKIVSFYGMIRLPEAWRSACQSEPLECLVAGDASSVLAIIGDKDTWTPPDDVQALVASGVHVQRYADGEHGFAHDVARPAHRVADAADAFLSAGKWLRS